MKIKSLHLKNFKRFTDLTLGDIPASAKLVLLIGSNGSGKSSVFDAFEALNKKHIDDNKFHSFNDQGELEYYRKDKGDFFEIKFIGDNSEKEQFISSNSGFLVNTSNSFYGRSAVRYLPKLTKTVLGTGVDVAGDEDRPKFYNEIDKRFENDIDLIMEDIIKRVFGSFNNGDKGQIDEVRLFLERINTSLQNIFDTSPGNLLTLLSITPPADGVPIQIIFKKGKSTIHYDVLSAGEKEVLNLLFNLYTRTKVFTDTIYFIDEMDSHLNTLLQIKLLKEITEKWIPDNCQLWTASHSLGFIQYAKETDHSVIFDFDDYDFDFPKVLFPTPKENADVYEIAVSKDILPALFKDYKIYFVENKDRIIYSGLNIANTLFVQENGKQGVYHKVKNGDFSGIVDRDFLSNNDIQEIEKQYSTLKVLRYYSIENYLFHPDNLTEYYSSEVREFDRDRYIKNILSEKIRVKEELIRKIALIRTAYPFFKEPEQNGKPNQKRFTGSDENFQQVAEIQSYLDSDLFEDYYKVFPMKDYGTAVKERQNISKVELAKTNWFKEQIKKLIQE